MWAVATIVVALVAGFLIYTAMTMGDDSDNTTTAGTGEQEQPVDADQQQDPGPTSDEGAAASGRDDSTAPETTAAAEQTARAEQTTPAEQTEQPTMTEEQRQFLLDLPRREADDPLAKGEVDAPVVIIEYADYRCPFCASWAREVQPELQELIDQGTVRLEFRDRVLFGEQSEATALAARAAGEQGMYWEYHDAVFAAAPASGHPEMPREKLLGLAEQIGIPDMAKFTDDLDSPELRAAMAADQAEGDSLGVRSTPTFLVNTVALIGAQPADVFKQAIEQELAKTQN